MQPKNETSLKSTTVALYCRVSTNTQTTENQKIKLLQYAATNNLKFHLYDEIESSRKTRPVKQELLRRLRTGEYSTVIVYKLDRWARSSRELILEMHEFVDRGIGFISLSENLDFSTSVGRLHYQILASFAEFERSLISERTKEGIARTKMQGTILGRPKGAKDKSPRPKGGYYLREANKRKSADTKQGKFQNINSYLG